MRSIFLGVSLLFFVDNQRFFIPGLLGGIGRIGHNQFKRLVVLVLEIGQGALTGDIELVLADVVALHLIQFHGGYAV